mmetsp:Transcript_24416/g.78442  ORF Transcript_24416/g.78442 Transcript_24416/m.78442 type:complete len:284 (+) Transcript_24416:323-1174(+)
MLQRRLHQLHLLLHGRDVLLGETLDQRWQVGRLLRRRGLLSPLSLRKVWRFLIVRSQLIERHAQHIVIVCQLPSGSRQAQVSTLEPVVRQRDGFRDGTRLPRARPCLIDLHHDTPLGIRDLEQAHVGHRKVITPLMIPIVGQAARQCRIQSRGHVSSPVVEQQQHILVHMRQLLVLERVQHNAHAVEIFSHAKELALPVPATQQPQRQPIPEQRAPLPADPELQHNRPSISTDRLVVPHQATLALTVWRQSHEVLVCKGVAAQLPVRNHPLAERIKLLEWVLE